MEPATSGELAEIVRSVPRLVLRGGGTKPALAPASPEALLVSLRRLSGVTAWQPLDFHLTAKAGTPLAEIQELLAGCGQCLAFEPPCLSPSSTIGGCVAAALEGPGAFRSGAARDHLLAVEFCDGAGRLLRAGARVLKNSAGPDVPRFLAGSLGRFAAMTEVTVRTRPFPASTATVAWPCTTLERAVTLVQDLGAGPWALDALDLEGTSPDNPLWVVLARVAGRPGSVPQRAARIVQASSHPAFILSPAEAAERWAARLRLQWVPPGQAVVKVPITLSGLAAFDAACAALETTRTYSLGGRLAWVALPAPGMLEGALHRHGWKGLLIRGPSTFTGSPFLGGWLGSPLMRRLKHVFDPNCRFPPWPEADVA